MNRSFFAALVTMMVVTAAEGAQQPPQQPIRPFTLELAGGGPNLTIEVFLNAGKLGETTLSSTGAGDFVLDLANLGKSRMQVYVDVCKDGKVVKVLFVSATGQPPPKDEDCDRRLVAVSFESDCGVTRFTLNLRNFAGAAIGCALTTTPESAVSGDGGALGWLIDVDFGSAQMRDADKSCEEVSAAFQPTGIPITCAKDANVPFFSVDAGITFARFAGVKVGYLQLGQVTLDASGSSGGRTVSQDGFFGTTRGVTFTGVLRVPLGRVVPFVEGGLWRWSAESGSTVTASVGSQTFSETFSQDNNGVDPIFRGGVEIWFTPSVGLSGGVTTVRLVDAGNADEGEVDERFTAFFVGMKIGRR